MKVKKLTNLTACPVCGELLEDNLEALAHCNGYGEVRTGYQCPFCEEIYENKRDAERCLRDCIREEEIHS